MAQVRDILSARRQAAEAARRLWREKVRRKQKLKGDGKAAPLVPIAKDAPIIAALQAGVGGAELRALAEQEGDHRIAKRKLAKACRTEGLSTGETARRLGVFDVVVERHRRRSGKKLEAGPAPKRRPRPRLTEKQIRKVIAFHLANPDWSWTELVSHVRERFGVEYSNSGLTRIVKARMARATER